MKKCSCCNIDKPETDFYKDKSVSGGLRSQCKACFHKKYLPKTKACRCGCGTFVTNTWAWGHKQRVDNIAKNPEVRIKISIAHTGKKITTRQKESLRLGSIALTGKHRPNHVKEAARRIWLGKKLTPEHRYKVSAGLKKFYKSPEGAAKIHQYKKIHKKQWLDPEYRKKVLHRRPMSWFEQCTQNIITKHNLPYKFVGNGSFWIGRFNPDFISTGKGNILIEVYGTFQKKQLHQIDNYETFRRNYFKRYGFNTIFLNEKDIRRADREEHILKKIGGQPCLHS